MNAMSRLLLGGKLDREVLLGAERSTLMVVVVGLLFSTSMDVLDVTQRERQVQDVTSAWLEETGYRVEGLEVDGEDVYVRIVGTGDAPDAQLLCDELAEKNVGVESVSVSVLEERRVTSGA